MNRLHRLLAGLGIAAIALAGCGGGGSTTPKVSQGPAGAAVHFPLGTAPPAFSSRTSIGSVKITLALPKVLTGKTNAQSVRAHLPGKATTTGQARRAPSALGGIAHTASQRSAPHYVDPSCPGECYANVLDIYVDGTLIPNLDGQVGNGDSMYVQYTADGTQSTNLPIFSTNTNDIVAVEWDGNFNYVLAMGETYVGNFTAGSTENISLTMLQNTKYVGIVDALEQNTPQLLTSQSQPFYGLAGDCDSSDSVARRSSPQVYSQLYNSFGLYSADALGSFVAQAGYGGTSTPQITSEVSDNGGGTKAGQTSIPGLYLVNWDYNCDGVTVTATAVNPAYAIVTDVYGPYQYTHYVPDGSSTSLCWNSAQGREACSYDGPFDQFGNATFGYQNCAVYGGTHCPGGPYQGIWNLSWGYSNYYDGWYPVTGYNSDGLYPGIYGPSAGGIVDISNTYPSFSVSPTSLSLLATGQSQNVTIVDLTGYNGAFYDTSENTSVATVSQIGNQSESCCGNGVQFTITAQSAGTTNIDFSDYNGRSFSIQVTVTTTTLPIQ